MEILVSLIGLFISIFFFRFSIGSFSLSKMSMISYLFYFHIILLTYIGVIAVASHLDIKLDTYYYAITGAVSDESRLLGWYATIYSVIFLPIGMIFANILFLGKLNASPLIQSYQIKKIDCTFKVDKKEKILFFTLIIFTIIATLAVLYVFFIIKSFPLLSMLSGTDALELRQIRGTAKLGFGGITAIRDMIALPLPPLLSYIAYITYKNTDLYHYRLLFYYLVILSILILTYNIEKAPVLLYGMSFLFLKSFLDEMVNLSKLIFYASIILILLVLAYLAVSGLDSISEVINLLLTRVFVAQTSAIFLAYEYFPLYHDFLGWSGVSGLFSSLLAETPVSSGRIIFEIYAPQSVADGTAGYMVGLFTAEAWILFGIWGVILSPLWVGFFIQTLHLLIIRSPKNAILLAAYIYIMMHWSLAGGLATFMYPIVLFIFLIQVFSIYLVSYIIKTIVLQTKQKEIEL